MFGVVQTCSLLLKTSCCRAMICAFVVVWQVIVYWSMILLYRTVLPAWNLLFLYWNMSFFLYWRGCWSPLGCMLLNIYWLGTSSSRRDILQFRLRYVGERWYGHVHPGKRDRAQPEYTREVRLPAPALSMSDCMNVESTSTTNQSWVFLLWNGWFSSDWSVITTLTTALIVITLSHTKICWQYWPTARNIAILQKTEMYMSSLIQNKCWQSTYWKVFWVYLPHSAWSSPSLSRLHTVMVQGWTPHCGGTHQARRGVSPFK